MSTPADRTRMAKAIVDFEARRDESGHLKVYNLPANDGGGRYEVAGLNERYNKVVVDELIALISAGRYADAEAKADDAVAKDTDPAASMTHIPAVEFYLRDCVFNRGAKGARRIMQRALRVEDDGEIGPKTVAAQLAAEKDPEEFLQDLRWAREDYERVVVGYRSNLWAGLINRFDKALVTAKTFPMAAPAGPQRNWLQLLIEFILQLFRGVHPAVTGVKTLPWMRAALNEIGFHEIGENRGIEKYVEGGKCGAVGEPWCAAFVNWCFESVGMRGTRSAMARSFENSLDFVKLDGPAYGAIGTMWRVSKNSGLGHVFFYLGERSVGDGTEIQVLGLGGNQKDSVCRQYHPRDRIVGYYWPKGYPLPKTGPVSVSTEATTGSET